MHNKCIANGGESWYNVNSKKLQLGYKISVRLINPNKYAKIPDIKTIPRVSIIIVKILLKFIFINLLIVYTF